jgi:hypothetical protein
MDGLSPHRRDIEDTTDHDGCKEHCLAGQRCAKQGSRSEPQGNLAAAAEIESRDTIDQRVKNNRG